MIKTITILGLDPIVTDVTISQVEGLPGVNIVGMSSMAVREARHRVRSALRAGGYEWPEGRVNVVLAPADIGRTGCGYDLPIAIGVLQLTGIVPTEATEGAVFVGELALDGSTRAVPGAIVAAMGAVSAGARTLYVPEGVAEEANLLGLDVVPVRSLVELVEHLNGRHTIPSVTGGHEVRPKEHASDLAMVRGQYAARRALEVAAAGGHNLFLVGPPGCLRGDEPIYDPTDGTRHTVAERYHRGIGFHVWAMGPTGPVVTAALPPVKYAAEQMIRVRTESGTVTVTPNHRFMSETGWMTASEVYERHQASVPARLRTSSESFLSARAEDALRWRQSTPGSLVDYRPEYRSGGVPLLPPAVDAGAFSPSRGDAPERSLRGSQPGGQEGESARSHACRSSDLPSTHGCSLPPRHQVESAHPLEGLHPATGAPHEYGHVTTQAGLLPRQGSDPLCTESLPAASAHPSTPHVPSRPPGSTAWWTDGNSVSSLVLAVDLLDDREPYYDFHVPVFNNYWASGLWNHNCGKTLLVRALPSILPPMTYEESLEVTRVHSVSGLTRSRQGLITTRPFRSPHSSCSENALVGGGNPPHPGEASLAHNGVLFLDEVLEFRRATLEALKWPLKEGFVDVARARRTLRFPTRAHLVAASNPCACGWHNVPGAQNPTCRCTPAQVAAYQARYVLAEHTDLYVQMQAVPPKDLYSPTQPPVESSAAVRERVVAARNIQRQRNVLHGRAFLNAELPVDLQHAAVDMNFLAKALETLGALQHTWRVRKVARTIADLAGAVCIQRPHLMEAIALAVPK